jgi:hypothetical protein
LKAEQGVVPDQLPGIESTALQTASRRFEHTVGTVLISFANFP